jgi:aspartate-semialdehyde dehydrogenase
MKERIPVAVLGATGSVGQRFLQLLDGHPWFEVVSISGSERSIGKSFGEVCQWVVSEPMPEYAKDMVVLPSTPKKIKTPVVFSALPTNIAKAVEPDFANSGINVFSNASAYRQEPDVPILLPEINAEHIGLVQFQRKTRNWDGCIVTNSNCTSAGVSVALKALYDAFGLKNVFLVSLQALSGAGYPGVSSVDIIDNVIPYIPGEEEKVALEPRKILGRLNKNNIELAEFAISAHTNRVAVVDGHLACLSVGLRRSASIEEVVGALSEYQAPEMARNLPSAPHPVIHVSEQPDRPQPRFDRWFGKGMTTVVGRVREDEIFDLRLIVLSHNTVRGAAGGSIYNAELFIDQGLV